MTQPAEKRIRENSAPRLRSNWLLIAVCWITWAAAAPLVAQVESNPIPPEPPSATDAVDPEGVESEPAAATPPQILEKAGSIQYVGPDTYILLDAQGRPQPVPGMTYEDFMQAWKKSQPASKADSTPRYVLESINLQGATRDGFAELDFTAIVGILVDERVKVPLGLIGAILKDQPEFSSADHEPRKDDTADPGSDETRDGEDYLTQDPNDGGVVAHIDGRAGQRRRISLQLIVPLSRDGAESTLQLSCPRAVSSNLTLTTRSMVADANVNAGTLIRQDPLREGGTRLHVVGPVGPFRLTWHSTENTATEYATVLSSAGAVRVSIDGRSVRSEARLRVQSYGGGFDRFRVRLPPGAQLVPDPAVDATADRPKYRVIVESSANGPADAGASDAGQIVRIEFPEKQLAPVTIELATEQPIGLKGERSAVELAGFEVLGAVRQFGDVALLVADDWQARWQIGNHVRQVDTGDLEPSLQQPELSAAFQYDRQPWSLGVRIESRQTRIHVTPQYELQCLPDEARLTLRLNYQVYGARAFEFQVRMKGWQITGSPLESGGLVDLDKILRGEEDILTLPLSQASTPRAEITLSLRLPLPRGNQTVEPSQAADERRHERIELPLPVPVAASIGTGNLIVRTTPDFELRPDLENSVGLTLVTTTDAADTQAVDRASLNFRSVLPDAVFVADLFSRTKRISAEILARVELLANGAMVEQQFDYDVQHVPAKELLFEAANELWRNEDKIEAVLVTSVTNDESETKSETPLTIAPTAEDLGITGSGADIRFRVPLSQPRLGQFSVRVRYHIPRPETAGVSAGWLLPLVRPFDVQEARLRAQVEVPRGQTVALDPKFKNSTWKATTGNSKSEQTISAYAFDAERAEPVLPLIVSASPFEAPSAITVDRIWLQSWFSGGTRQDRTAIRFNTAGLQATVELPPQSPAAEVEILLDGEPANVLSQDRGRVVVRLDQSTDNETAAEAISASHTLELRSRQAIRTGLLTRHELTPPMLNGGRELSQVFWQIILPGDEHIIRSPERLSSAGRWQWLGSFWGQRPIMSQAELEKWAEASVQIGPAPAQNEYLYTGLAPTLSIEFVTAPRWLVVLLASSAVLAVGLLLMYVPVARRGWILVAAACLIAVLAVAFPLPALLLAQAATIGVVVSLLALLLRRATARPTHWPVTVSAGSSQRQVSSRTDSMLMPPAISAASTAPTVPLRISDSQQ